MRQLHIPPIAPSLTAEVSNLTQRLTLLEDDFRVSASPPDLADTSWVFWVQAVRDVTNWTLTTCFNTRLPTGEAIEWVCKTLPLPTPGHGNAVPISPDTFSQILPHGISLTYRVPAAGNPVNLAWPEGSVSLVRWDGLDVNQNPINGINGYSSPLAIMSGDTWNLRSDLSVDTRFIRWTFNTASGVVSYTYPAS